MAAALVAVLLGGPDTPTRPPPAGSHQLYSPFTGEPVPSLGPVLAVKIDNLAQARPQTGLPEADTVYILPVEGGLSRILAVFSLSYPAASFMFRWSATDGRWLVWVDGTPARAAEGGQLSAPTVVIQYTTVRTSRFREQGVRPPYAQSTGAGTGVVLRGGRAYAIRWSRPDANGGTAFTTTSGQAMTFARGPVWVVLAATP